MNYPKPKIDMETAVRLWQEEHSEYAKEQIALNSVGTVMLLLKQYGLNQFDEDLAQVGMVGVLKAISSFDGSKGVKFSAYASAVARNEIMLYLRNSKSVQTVSLEKELREDGDRAKLKDIIPSKERFEDLSILKMDIERNMWKFTEKEKQALYLLAKGERQVDVARKFGDTRANIYRITKSIQQKMESDNARAGKERRTK